MPLKGNMEFVKELNRSLVIRRIRDDGPISRTELAAATELGLSTITYIVEELLADGLVREAGTASSSAGRKRVMLQFNNGRYFIAGAKIEESCIEFGVSDLNGTILERIQAEFAALPTESGPVNDIMIQSIRELSVPLREAGMECLGVGIAVSGLVDRSTLKVVSSPFLSWENLEFTKLREALGVPVYLDNDANVYALAEKWVGHGKGYSNFIAVTVGPGIGSGIMLGNTLYTGGNGDAGEFGHTVIQGDGAVCYCGQRGCLELYASDKFVVSEAYRAIVYETHPTRLKELNEVSAESVCLLAGEGDECARGILTRRGEYLGIGLRNLINLFNPQAIMLGGEGLCGSQYLMEGIRRRLGESEFRQPFDLHLSQLGEDAWLIGACGLVESKVFKRSGWR